MGERDLSGLVQVTFGTRTAVQFAPFVFVLAYWLQSDWAIVAATLYLPLAGVFARENRGRQPARPDFAASVAGAGDTGVLFLLSFDDLPVWIARKGPETQKMIRARALERLTSATRSADLVTGFGEGFAVLMQDVRDQRPEHLVQIAARLQKALSEAMVIDNSAIYPTCSVGVAGLKSTPAANRLLAAETALEEAAGAGAATIRVHDKSSARRRMAHDALGAELDRALSSGEICAHFQPQIATESGRIAGFEALARWHHPRLGLLAPGAFLDIVEASGKSERLTEVILLDALRALAAWDRAGHRIPAVGVNFSTDQLRNPRLVEYLKWEVDRFDLAPDRIAVEILETVISAHEDDVITRNIRALADHGFAVDLDDFGTGHASIANIRRFQVSRLKIDRSFICGLEQDPEQQAMANAILRMAEGLGLDCVAEGVETIAEHHKLAAMGCRFVQGFGIARPMPFEETAAWIAAYRSRLTGNSGDQRKSA